VVMQHKETKTDDAAGAGAEGGRRPTVVPDPAASFEECKVEDSADPLGAVRAGGALSR
jgi:hypothetical protein